MMKHKGLAVLVVMASFLWFLTCASFASTSSPALSPRKRGIGIVVSSKAASGKVEQMHLYDKMVAVIIGIDRYEDLPPSAQLTGAVRDAKGMARVLREHYAFNRIIELYNEQATREQIIRVLQGDLSNLGVDDGVLIYFAGHGITVPTSQGKDLGFLVPYDGSLDHDKMYKNISMQQIKSDISPMIPAKHVLLIVDACFGGLLLDTRSASVKAKHDLAYLREITREPVRQIITAGGKGQTVLDGGPGDHSVFTGRLIQELKRVRDFITAQELGVIIERKVYGDAVARGHEQRPQVGKVYGTGDFVFVPDLSKRQARAEKEVQKLEAELARLKQLKKQAALLNQKARERELERQRLIKEADLKQARLRQKAAQMEAEQRRRLETELKKDRMERERQERERRQRIAYLKKQTQKILKELGGSPATALGIDQARDEVLRIRRTIQRIKKDYEKELDRQLWSMQLYYEKQFKRASDIKPFDKMFETREDYLKRRGKAEAKIKKLIEEKEQKEAAIRKQIEAELKAQIDPLYSQIKEITKQRFQVGPKEIAYKFVRYHPDIEAFDLACTIRGIYSTGLVHIPKAKARTYYDSPDLLVASAELVVADSGLVFPLQFAMRGPEGDTYKAKVLRTIKDKYTGMEFVYVPGGCYEMGCGDWAGGDCNWNEKPVHTVCLDGFYIGKYEVTQGQWRKVIGRNPSYFKGDDFPVEHASWYDVQKFIKKLNRITGRNYRLPTEAEWEYAARSGGKKEKYAGGSDVDQLAWYRGNSGGHTHPVGTKAPNGLGIYDMSGNVWEWCQDVYSENAYRHHTLRNPVYMGAGSYRAMRGGDWDNRSRYLRCPHRGGSKPEGRYDNLGFRLVLPVK